MRRLQGKMFHGQILDASLEQRDATCTTRLEKDVENVKAPAITSTSGNIGVPNSVARACLPDQRGRKQTDYTSTVNQSTQTDAALTSVNAGIQSESAAFGISVGCQAVIVGSNRSTGCQTDADRQRRSAGTQTEQISIVETYAVPARMARPCFDFERRWLALPLVKPDSLRELVLHPAESVWVFLFRCAETIRKTFKIRDLDEEMQALTLDWLARHDEDEVRKRVELQLTRLLRVSLPLYRVRDALAETSHPGQL